MKTHALKPLIVLPMLATIAYGQTSWSPQHAPVETRWAKDVSPTNALPDYPRPQLVRKEWVNLNGLWQFAFGNESDNAPIGKDLDRQILVPYAAETASSGIMDKGHHERLWYRRMFSVPAAWAGKNVVLHFDAVDYESEVFVNGQSLGVHKGGYEPFSLDVTKLLKGTGPQELIVRVYDPTDKGGQPRGKQTAHPGGIMYTSTTGIWQTVWMEPVSPSHIESLKLVPDIDQKVIKVTVNATAGTRAKIIVKGQAPVEVAANTETAITISNPKLWSPTNPYLYDLDVKLIEGGKVIDQVSSYFGMRKISLGKVNGITRMLLNNQPLFHMGPLDQGYWPESGLTPPTEAAMKNDLLVTKQLGFNMIRKHIKVEPQRWYYWTDRLGIMVWQDMPSPNSYTGNPPPIDRPAYEKQLDNIVGTHFNAPSIVMWVIFNEEQARHDTAKLVAKAKSLDPSRLVNRDSGGGFDEDNQEGKVGDIDDIHSYPPPGTPRPSADQALVCGEYGGLGYIIADHMWQKRDNWGYALMPNQQELHDTYGEYTNLLKQFSEKNGLSGAVYTQITDVEIESNGLMTYDRILKVDPAKIALANRFGYPRYDTIQVVPTSEEQKQTWQYTFTAPANDWTTVQFNDSRWKTGLGGFGHDAPNPIGTQWTTSDVWIRRKFALPKLDAKTLSQLLIRNCHDENIEVWINGVKAFEKDGYIGNYENRPMAEAARKALVVGGENTIAVHCHQTIGGQFVDVGLARRVPAK